MLEALVVVLLVVIVVLVIFMVRNKRSKDDLTVVNESLANSLDRELQRKIAAESLVEKRDAEIAKLKKAQTKTVETAVKRVEDVLNNKGKRRSHEVAGLKYAIKIVNNYINE